MVVRLVLSNAVLGRPYHHLALDMMQLYLGLGDMFGEVDASAGLPTNYVARWVCPVIEHMGACSAVAVLGQHLFEPLAGLRIPTDIETWGDPYSIGSLFSSAKSTVMVTGVVGSTPGFNRGTSAIFAHAESSGTDDRHRVDWEAQLTHQRSRPTRGEPPGCRAPDECYYYYYYRNIIIL